MSTVNGLKCNRCGAFVEVDEAYDYVPGWLTTYAAIDTDHSAPQRHYCSEACSVLAGLARMDIFAARKLIAEVSAWTSYGVIHAGETVPEGQHVAPGCIDARERGTHRLNDCTAADIAEAAGDDTDNDYPGGSVLRRVYAAEQQPRTADVETVSLLDTDRDAWRQEFVAREIARLTPVPEEHVFCSCHLPASPQCQHVCEPVPARIPECGEKLQYGGRTYIVTNTGLSEYGASIALERAK